MNKQVSYAYQHLSRTETLGKCIHGSMYLCPALLIALGKFEYYGSGGCQIGDSIDSHNRPFSHIASVIECFNVSVKYPHVNSKKWPPIWRSLLFLSVLFFEFFRHQ